MWQVANELYHHGILGQKWGIRRFQNEDGTLTEEGKRRYNKRLMKDLTKNYKFSDPVYKISDTKYTDQLNKDILTLVGTKSNLINKSMQIKKLEKEINSEQEKFWDTKECKKIMTKIENKFEKEYGRKPKKFGEHSYDLNDIELMDFDNDELVSAKEKYYENNKKYKKIHEDYIKLNEEYRDECEKLTNYIVSEEFKDARIPTNRGSKSFDREIYTRISRAGGLSNF